MSQEFEFRSVDCCLKVVQQMHLVQHGTTSTSHSEDQFFEKIRSGMDSTGRTDPTTSTSCMGDLEAPHIVTTRHHVNQIPDYWSLEHP